ncbi:hypothetical protein AB0N09_05980 [Streptomyces erythrochromogenes]|uniref:hypothetical protein n=1 Tax=Streptomyces erythrochromogenes TaxID=285574 RepID=UPI003423F99F
MSFAQGTADHAAQEAWLAARDAYRTATASLLIHLQPLLRRDPRNEEAPWSHLAADLPHGGRVTIQLSDGNAAQVYFTDLHRSAAYAFTSGGQVHFGDVLGTLLPAAEPGTHTRHLYRAEQRLTVHDDEHITGNFTLPIVYLMHGVRGLTEPKAA